jgi:hypothetical protein
VPGVAVREIAAATVQLDRLPMIAHPHVPAGRPRSIVT